MLIKAAELNNINLKSYMIGDRSSDILCGKRVDVKQYLSIEITKNKN